MKPLFTQGPCDPSQLANPFMQAASHLFNPLDPSSKIISHSVNSLDSGIRQQLSDLKLANQVFGSHQSAYRQQQMAINAQMQMAFKAQQARLASMNQLQMQRAWQSQMLAQNSMQMGWKQAQLSEQALSWRKQAQMKEAFQKAILQKQEQQRIQTATGSMIELMMNDSEPKFKDSKFLAFLKDIQEKKLVIKGKELIQNRKEPSLDQIWKKHEEEFNQNYQSLFGLDHDLMQVWDQSQEAVQSVFPKDFDKIIEETFARMGADLQLNKDMEKIYKEGDRALIEKMQDFVYVFKPDNPFMDHESPVTLAYTLLADNRAQEAILALQAHLFKTNDAEGWRVLGKVYQQLDQDNEAISCLFRAYQQNSTNLDNILSLGISCANRGLTNETLHFLRDWITKHPVYSQAIQKLDGISRRLALVSIFQQAVQKFPMSEDLLNAAGVLHFIDRNLVRAAQLFERCVQINSQNYLAWNKMGTAHSHMHLYDKAIQCYQRALQIHPNYVRAWANLAIAHNSKGDYEQSANFHLNALVLMSQAQNIWKQLQRTFNNLGREDLVQLAAKRNPDLFRSHFELITRQDLPLPIVPYNKAFEEFVLKEQGADWFDKLRKP